MDTERLLKIGKKYKKWFEQFELMPFSYRANDADYYLVVYTKSGKDAGYAVVSLDNFEIKDANISFSVLYMYSGYAKNFFDIGQQRSNITPDFFYSVANETTKLLNQKVNGNGNYQVLQKGKILMEQLGSYQEELIERYQDFEHHYDNYILKENRITEKELDRVIEEVACLDRLQYLQGKDLIENFSILNRYRKELDHHNILNKLPSETRKFINELLMSSKEVEKTIKPFQFEAQTAHLSKEEQIKEMKKHLYEKGYRKVEEYKQKLRYPSMR